jgi:Bacterial extracellular solute-binding proteins, family 5 Middle
MGIFNNLIMFDQHVKQNAIKSVVPDLATGWSWSEDGTELTFALRQGVKWHDGKPFTAADVKCTWDLLLGKANDKLRVNPRKSWYRNLAEVTTNGDYEVTFRLERPQPAFVMHWPRVIRWSIRAMLLRPRCGSIPSAPDPLDLSSLSRADHADPQPGLLEERAALSRRHRVHDHPRHVDREPGLTMALL